MEGVHLRNFKDFLLMFNQVSEKCFVRCVDNFNTRTLSPYEEQCVDNCAKKFVNINHRVMGVYIGVQASLTQKRINEVEEQNSSNALPNQEQLSVTSNSAQEQTK